MIRLLLQVRVEAGCRVQQVADYLKPYGLSLQNYASIREQQIGGYTQVQLSVLVVLDDASIVLPGIRQVTVDTSPRQMSLHSHRSLGSHYNSSALSSIAF